MNTLRHALRLRTGLVVLVLLALVAMQSLSLLHRLVHAGAAAAEGTSAQVKADAGTPDAGDWLRLLFAGHDHHGCEAYDQLTHADALWSSPALALPTVAVAAPGEVHHAWHLAHQAAGFLARGPPLLS